MKLPSALPSVRFPILITGVHRLPLLSLLILALVPVLTAPSRATVSLAPVFGDHMVLQQGTTLPVWGTAAPGEKITVSLAGQEAGTTADPSGRWRVTLRPLTATDDQLTMVVSGGNRIEIGDILAGDVWLTAGDGEIATPLSEVPRGKAAAGITDSGTRFFMREGKEGGRWIVVSRNTSPSFPAIPFFFARDLRAIRRTPVGILDCTVRDAASIASWIPPEGLAGLALPSREARGAAPSESYRSLVAPLIPFAITGIVWDQDASEARGMESIRQRLFLRHLIRDWRKLWGEGPFPFLMVSPPASGEISEARDHAVAPLRDARGTVRGGLPWIREGIALALQLPQTGVAECSDLAPSAADGSPDALMIGRRLALQARATAYGETVVSSGPVFREMKTGKHRVTILFDHAEGGLVIGSAPGSSEEGSGTVARSVEGFSLMDGKGKWFPAEALIEGESVILSSDAVPEPVGAAYAWSDSPDGNLYNRQGLPARPFMTGGDR